MKFEAEYNEEFLGGVVKITAKDKERRIIAIPYYCWDNREDGKMKVWIPVETKEERLYSLI